MKVVKVCDCVRLGEVRWRVDESVCVERYDRVRAQPGQLL